MRVQTRRAILAAGIAAGLVAGAAHFIVHPGTEEPAGAALFVGEVLLLSALGLYYAIWVEGRRKARIALFLACLVLLAWSIEAVALRSGLLGGGYSYRAKLLQPGLGGVPLMVLLAWALFGLLSSSITRFLLNGVAARTPCAPPRLPALGLAMLVNGAVMLGIDLAVEWHFSGAAGFWAWKPPAGGPAYLLDGVPWGNFLLWAAVGVAAQALERLTGTVASASAPAGAAGFPLRAAPALGFALLLAVGAPLNLAAGAPGGALACGAGFLAVAARLAVLVRARGRGNLRAFG